MILNIDLKPGLENNLYIEDFNLATRNLIDSSRLSLYGNVGKMEYFYRIFSVDSIATGFLGSGDRELYYRLLNKPRGSSFIEIKDSIFKNVNIISSTGLTSLENKVKLTKDEITDFINHYHSLLDQVDSVVICDELSESLPLGLYRNLLNIASLKEKTLVLDLKNRELFDIVDANVDYLLMDRELLEDISRLSLDSKESMALACNYVLEKDVKTVVINLYEEGLLLVSQEGAYFIDRLAGDFIQHNNYGLLAALTVGLEKNYDQETFLRLIQACNILSNSQYYMENIDLLDIKRSMNILKINKL